MHNLTDDGVLANVLNLQKHHKVTFFISVSLLRIEQKSLLTEN